MRWIDLESLKRQCRVDFPEDDLLLATLGATAEAEVVRITGRTEAELTEMGEGAMPLPLRQAMLIRAAQFYRDAEGTEKPNALFESLIRPFRKLT